MNNCCYKKLDIITSLELALGVNPVWLLTSYHPVAFIYQPVQKSWVALEAGSQFLEFWLPTM
jgi:hypothetical protein